MTSTFRQAFLNISGGGQSSFGGGLSRAPSIPSGERFVGHSPIPMHVPVPTQVQNISIPSVETTSMREGVDYHGNQFINKPQLIESISAATGNKASHDQDIMNAIIQGVENYIQREQKGKEPAVRFNTKQLPEGISWQDLEIHLVNFSIMSPKSTRVVITIPGTDFEWKTDMEDIGLYDRKRMIISSEGMLLGLLSTGKLFSWSTGGSAPDSFRTAKARLSAVLEKYFGLKGSPIILQGDQYELLFQISSGRQVKKIFEGKNISDLYH